MMTDSDDDRSVFDTALAVTAMVSEAGYGLLPENPTIAMLEAGVKETGLSLEQISLAYRAMHRVAISELGPAAHDPIALVQKLLMSKKAH